MHHPKVIRASIFINAVGNKNCTTQPTWIIKISRTRYGCFEIRIVTIDFKVNAAPKTRHTGSGRDLQKSDIDRRRVVLGSILW